MAALKKLSLYLDLLETIHHKLEVIFKEIQYWYPGERFTPLSLGVLAIVFRTANRLVYYSKFDKHQCIVIPTAQCKTLCLMAMPNEQKYRSYSLFLR